MGEGRGGKGREGAKEKTGGLYAFYCVFWFLEAVSNNKMRVKFEIFFIPTANLTSEFREKKSKDSKKIFFVFFSNFCWHTLLTLLTQNLNQKTLFYHQHDTKPPHSTNLFSVFSMHLWSSGYDYRLPSDLSGFDSRWMHHLILFFWPFWCKNEAKVKQKRQEKRICSWRDLNTQRLQDISLAGITIFLHELCVVVLVGLLQKTIPFWLKIWSWWGSNPLPQA